MVYDSNSSDPLVQFDCENRNGITIIRIEGRFRANDFKDFNRLFQKFLDEEGTWLLLDMTRTKVIQSPVIGSIMGFSRLLNQVNKNMGIVNPSEHIRYILDLTRMTEMVQVFEDVDQAITYIAMN